MFGSRRDPRAPLASTQKNITIRETCEFYGTRDAIAQCSYPRSCRDCLEMKDCALTASGLCMNATAAALENTWLPVDYHEILHKNETGTDTRLEWKAGFFAANASYCPASEPVCSLCRKEFLREARGKGASIALIYRSFCVGPDGCVCLGICEVARPRTVEACAVEGPPIQTVLLQPFSTRKRDPRATLTIFQPPPREETCGFYSHSSSKAKGCRAPRTCQDCLQRKGCMIDGYKCVDDVRYSPTSDFRNSTIVNFDYGYTQFPSSNTTYCPADDATCARCRSERGDWAVSPWNGQFCVGANGCVCIAACEGDFWASLASDPSCRTNTFVEDVTLVVVAVVFVVVVVLAYSKINAWRSDPSTIPLSERLFRHMLDRPPILPRRLDLFGWRHFHEQLLEKEQRLLRGESVVSPVQQVEFGLATAPEMEEGDDSTAPVAVDPHALASAPVYAVVESVEPLDAEMVEPSAPELDEDEWLQWKSTRCA